MSDSWPAELAAVVDRIEAPRPPDVEPPADVTGVLAGLHRWWHTVSAGGPPAVASVASPATVDVMAALAEGCVAADRAIDAGATLLVPQAVPRDPVAARTLVALLTRKEASTAVYQPAGMPDRDWMLACATVRDRAAAAAHLRGEPVALLTQVGAPAIAGVVGILLAAAARRTACVIDGTDELAAALVADRICFRAKSWWLAATDSPDSGRSAAINRVDLAVGLPLSLSDDAGRGAAAVCALLAALTEA